MLTRRKAMDKVAQFRSTVKGLETEFQAAKRCVSESFMKSVLWQVHEWDDHPITRPNILSPFY